MTTKPRKSMKWVWVIVIMLCVPLIRPLSAFAETVSDDGGMADLERFYDVVAIDGELDDVDATAGDIEDGEGDEFNWLWVVFAGLVAVAIGGGITFCCMVRKKDTEQSDDSGGKPMEQGDKFE